MPDVRRVPRFELIRPALPSSQRLNPFTGQTVFVPGRPEQRTIFEVEQRGAFVETCVLKPGKRPKQASIRFVSATQAEREMAALIARKHREKYVEAGPSQMLAPATYTAGGATGSPLLLDELFRVGDPRFLDELLGCTNDKKLTVLAEPWLADPRPEMRRALLDYVDDGCDRAFHKGLVKHLFKGAEKNGDDEVMAHFLVAFDRIVRRYPVERWSWNRGEVTKEIVLASDPLVPDRLFAKKTSERFTRRTRRYLARRAFRYFRAIGRTDRARYGRAMRMALPLYRDAHLDTPVRLLDAWGLLHVLYAWSPVLERLPRGIRVTKGRSLAELAPAPYFKDAWLGGTDALLGMLAEARSRTVRQWSIAWLREHHGAALEGLPIGTVRTLLGSDDEDVARFGARLLERASGLEALGVAEWLDLLRIENVDIAPVVVAAFEKNVSPKRLSLPQIVALTGARIAAVAELGLRWAQDSVGATKRPVSGADLAVLARVAEATVPPVRQAGARWFLELLDAAPERRPEHVRDLFDSRFPDVRALAKEWLEKRNAADVPLWFALLESPYDDVRALVVKHAADWQAQAGVSELEHLAATVLLAVHRGSGTKRSMLGRLADRAAERPEEADRLLPLLSIALRSVRPPERIGALSALTRAAVGHDALRAAVARHLPELTISEQVAR